MIAVYGEVEKLGEVEEHIFVQLYLEDKNMKECEPQLPRDA
jgi:hypothetical protein